MIAFHVWMREKPGNKSKSSSSHCTLTPYLLPFLHCAALLSPSGSWARQTHQWKFILIHTTALWGGPGCFPFPTHTLLGATELQKGASDVHIWTKVIGEASLQRKKRRPWIQRTNFLSFASSVDNLWRIITYNYCDLNFCNFEHCDVLTVLWCCPSVRM